MVSPRPAVLQRPLFLFAALSLAGALVSYWFARISPAPFADAILYRADLLLGFDWREAYPRYVALPAIHRAMQLCYASIAYTPALLMAGLAARGFEQRIREFLVAYSIGLTATMISFFFLPAKSALEFVLQGRATYMPQTRVNTSATILALRDGALTDVSIDMLIGIVTFPSFHAFSAVLFMWSSWVLRWLRWPIVLINLGMLIATPIEGTHYLVDVIAGCLLAGAAVFAARSIPVLSLGGKRGAQSALPV